MSQTTAAALILFDLFKITDSVFVTSKTSGVYL
jgi:hypothetical protein